MKILFKHRARSAQTLVCVAAALIVLSWISADLQAGVYQVTYTAEDLMAKADFPVLDRQPTLIGAAPDTSIYFDRAANRPPLPRWEKLMELPLFPAGTLLPGQTYIISIVINHTWIPNVSTDNDWDPHFMIGDGMHLVGVSTMDQNQVDLAWCQDFPVEVADIDYDPMTPDVQQWVSYQYLTTGQPTLNVPYDVRLTWEVTGSTYMSVDNPGGSGGITSPVALNPAGPMTFVYVSDNQPHEEYQINSVTVRVEAEGITCNCGNPGFFDPPLDADVTTVKKGNRVIPLKFTLCNEEGYEVTDIDIASPPMAQVIWIGPPDGDLVEQELTVVGHGDEGNLFEFSGGLWQLNL